MKPRLASFAMLMSMSMVWAFSFPSLRPNSMASGRMLLQMKAATITTPLPIVVEKPMEMLMHDPIFRKMTKTIKATLNGAKAAGGASIMQQIHKIIEPTDVLVIGLTILCRKPLLKSLFAIQEKLRPLFPKPKYPKHSPRLFEDSLFGYLERPTYYAVWFLPFVYLIDILTIVMHFLGFDFHIKGDLPRLVFQVSSSLLCGSFITHIKDWFFAKSREDHLAHVAAGGEKRDLVRENTVNELTSILVWGMVMAFSLEAMSLEFGFALGSLFAVGGIGSASAVLALRSTFENVVGGLLLKLQDKFRVGETITLPDDKKKGSRGDEGCVESVGYVTTMLRKQDNSLVAVPNSIFTQGEIINWSRTPYRLFQTAITLPIEQLPLLPETINRVKTRLTKEEGVESIERDVIVAASGFKEGKILIEVSCHLVTSNDVDSGRLRTRVVDIIASVANEVKASSSGK